ncbi:hypothetical protein [Neorhizobium sp. P12A]|uniref:hypothetical protein n=1 Tax=Neorhizobium sp. P12A TaxID=2268027 RepID=UPI001FEDFD2D|nr:hypothetical protein [Neorhizobium sp. P12A]
MDTEEDVVMGAFRYRQQQTGLVYDLLPPERITGQRSHGFFDRKPDVTDAEFVTVLPVRGSAFSAKNFKANHSHVVSKPPAFPPAIAALAVYLRIAEQWLQRASGRVFAVLVVAMFVLVFGLSGGFSGLSTDQAAISDPLQFSHVTLTPRDANGMRILVLNGIIENQGESAISLKPVRADLVVDDRILSTIVVAPPVDRIKAGESRGFMARLQYPGGKMPEARLSFMP